LVDQSALQLSLFDEQDLVEISFPEFPGERLVCCHNPVLAEERARKRGDLLAATEKELTPIAAATGRAKRPLRGKDKIALRVGKVINHYKMAKHFTITITDESFTFTRNHDAITAEAALDGIYVLRTRMPTDTLAQDDVVLRYKGLEHVERLADRVRARETGLGPGPVSTTTSPPPPLNGPTLSPLRNAPTPHWPRPRVNAPPTAPRCTASPACSPI
jgi:hypothetical protein